MDEELDRWAARQAAKVPKIPTEGLRELAEELGIELGE